MIRRFTDLLIALAAMASLLILVLENSPAGAAWAVVLPQANAMLLSVFIADVAIRFTLSREKRAYATRHWYELLVFVPLVHQVAGVLYQPFAVIARLTVAVIMLISRTSTGNKPIASLSQQPAQTLVGGFLLTILVGAILLMLPVASATRQNTPFVEALFTATSATCVTGLSVCDISAYFSVFGQVVILGLIQVGGLGIMTAAVSLVLLVGRSVNVKGQAALQDTLDQESLSGVRQLTMFIVGMTVFFEFAGAAVLTAQWYGRLQDLPAAAFHGVFHAVSAFCNAGFSTFSDNLVPFREDVTINVTVALLIIAGGAGFTVIKDVVTALRVRLSRRGTARLRVQTRIVLGVSAMLILAGALAIYVLERDAALAGMTARGKILSSLFQSVTARTAGFNTCRIEQLSPPALFILIALMFIGASPGSTGGGIKTTTTAVLWAVVVTRLRRREQVELFRRTVPLDVILKSLSVFCISLILVMVFTGLLLYTERKPLMDVMFETVSAFGTVGLSTGLTPALTTPGRLLITAMMLIGRLGPLTMAYALAIRKKQPQYAYAEERVMIG